MRIARQVHQLNNFLSHFKNAQSSSRLKECYFSSLGTIVNFKLENLLVELELHLQKPEVRSNYSELARLISDDFIEFAATGCSFGKAEVLARLPDERAPTIETSQFAVRELLEGVCQVTYRAKLKKADDNVTSFSMRSSIWRQYQGDWQIVFHQGTPCKPF